MDQPPKTLSPLMLHDIDVCLADIKEEIIRAKAKHPGNFHNPHEGYAVALEEVDELWDEIKKDGGGRDLAARKEAMQSAAMFVRYMLEVCHQPLRTSRPLPPYTREATEMAD